MYTIKGAFLSKVNDFLMPSFSFLTAVASQSTLVNGPMEQMRPLLNYSRRYPNLDKQLPNYDNLYYDSDTLRNYISPKKNLKSLVQCQKDYPTDKNFVHSLEVIQQVMDNLEQLETIKSEYDRCSQVDIDGSTQSEIVLSV